MTKAIKPEHILANEQDFIEINGQKYRKGLVAAFVKILTFWNTQNQLEIKKSPHLI